MLCKVSTIFECSRIFSLPMTIMSWLVAFTYAYLCAGNILYGIMALVAVCFAHLGTNVLDDYFDYKSLIKQVGFDKNEYIKNAQKPKCRYLVTGMLKESEVLLIAGIYLFIAAIFGLFFYLNCGNGVLIFGGIGAIIALSYSLMSKIRLSEVAVAIAYGPALFGGIYYVMTKTFSWEALIVSVPTMIMTVILLYIHTVMDFDHDIKEGHLTIANLFDSQLDSLIMLRIYLIAAYLSPILLCIFDIADWQVFFVYLTIPLALDLHKSMTDYSLDNESVPDKKWFHFPMENMKFLKKINALSFMMRMYQSRNLMIYFSVFLSIALLLSCF